MRGGAAKRADTRQAEESRAKPRGARAPGARRSPHLGGPEARGGPLPTGLEVRGAPGVHPGGGTAGTGCRAGRPAVLGMGRRRRGWISGTMERTMGMPGRRGEGG